MLVFKTFTSEDSRCPIFIFKLYVYMEVYFIFFNFVEIYDFLRRNRREMIKIRRGYNEDC